MKILIIGNGYIGQRCKDVWGDQAVLSSTKVNTVEDVLALIDEHQPDALLNAAGVRGKPNVDWCELPENRLTTAFGNSALPVLIAQGCAARDTYLLHIGSGCVFYGESPDPDGWKEDDFANPVSFYSKCKYAGDLALGGLPNVGVARIRVPLDDRPYPGNIIDKLAAFEKIIDVKNSITVIPDMIDVFHQLMEKKGEGIFHVTNPGAIAYRDIIRLYEEKVGPAKVQEWISEQDLVTQGLAAKTRSTNTLQSANLEKIGIQMDPIEQAVEKAMDHYAQSR